MSDLMVIPNNIEDMSDAELAKFVGSAQEHSASQFPTLRVNYDDEDDDKNTLPRGHWCIATDGKRIFAPSVQFQIMFTAMQYSHYDPDEGKMVNQSVYFRNFGDDIPDIKGGQKCGSIPRKQREDLSKEEQDYQRNIKLAKVLFGLVTIDGVNQKGEPASAENVPCIFYAKGTHFMPMANYIDAVDKRGKAIPQSLIQMDLTRQKNGGVVYWEVTPTEAKTVKLNKDHVAAMSVFAQFVQEENDILLGKWKAARAKMGSPDMKEVAGAQEVIDPDLDDPLDFD